MLVTSAIITGLGLGAMYGLLALGFHITWVVSNTVNFAQGSSMMLGAVLGYTFGVTMGWPMPMAILAALLGCAIYGLAVERFLVRPFADRGSNGWLMATVAGGIVLDNVVLFTFGKEPRNFPSPWATDAVDVFGVGAFPLQLVIPVVGLIAAAALSFVLLKTKQGKAMSAVVQRPRSGTPDGDQHPVRYRRGVCRLDRFCRNCRSADRTLVQRLVRHGPRLRNQSLRDRYLGRH